MKSFIFAILFFVISTGVAFSQQAGLNQSGVTTSKATSNSALSIPDGFHEERDSNGNITASGNYKNGKKDGTWTEYGYFFGARYIVAEKLYDNGVVVYTLPDEFNDR